MSLNIFDRLRTMILKQSSKTAVLLIAKQNLVDDLRSQIKQLPDVIPVSNSEAELSWAKRSSQLATLILQGDPMNFLNWKMIRDTMFYEPNIEELKHLQRLPDWKRWRDAITESPVGNPKPYPTFKSSSGNLIHQAYSLSHLTAHCPIEDISQIVEFGGGYGSMCRLVHQLGFKGTYIIYDLPIFSALQEFFLKSVGISTKISRKATLEKCIVLLSDLDELSNQLKIHHEDYAFIATWSISEVNENLRSHIFDFASDASYYLIAYQTRFREIDNIVYFSKFIETRKDIDWFDFEIAHLPKSRYLIGVRKSN